MISMTYPKTTKTLGEWELRVSLTLDRKMNQEFRVGDFLSGSVELTNVGKTAIPLNNVNLILNERIRGPVKIEQKLIRNISLRGKEELLPGQSKTFRFQNLGKLRHPSFRGKRVMITNRISVRVNTSRSARVPLMQQMKQWMQDRNDELTFYFDLPTKPQPGVYRIKPRPLPTRWLPSGPRVWIPLWITFGLLLFTAKSGASPAVFHWIGLAVVLILVIGWLWRISLFRDSPMEIVASPGGSFFLRMLDRGDNSWQSLHVGYRVTETYLEGETRQQEKLVTKTLRRQSFDLKEIGQVRGSFIEARLPWPEEFLPHHKYPSGQGFGWEFALLRKNLLGNWSEVKWPVTVSWEHLPPPEEVLELKELKEQKEARLETRGNAEKL
jgi:hypothetical protein